MFEKSKVLYLGHHGETLAYGAKRNELYRVVFAEFFSSTYTVYQWPFLVEVVGGETSVDGVPFWKIW